MPVESAADRAVFVNPDEFGTTIVVQNAYGPAASVAAVLTREEGAVAGLDGETAIEGKAGLTAEIRADDLALVEQGDVVVADLGDGEGPQSFGIVGLDRDGTGMARLFLQQLDDARS